MAAKRKTKKKSAPRASTRPPAIPFRTVTPYLAVNGAAEAIGWYKRAFGAKELTRMPDPSGKLMHAELKIGDSRVMLSDVFPQTHLKDPRETGSTTVNLHIYDKNINRIWKKAVEAGAKVVMPLDNQFWGERYGQLDDPFGHSWAFSYPAKMTEAEKERKRQEAFRSVGGSEQPGLGEGD